MAIPAVQTDQPSDMVATVTWRWNLTLVSISVGGVLLVHGVVTPFLPLYLNRDLGVTDRSALALWTGLVAGAIPLMVAISSPVWGSLADRFGRKSVLVRATIWAGLTYIISGFVQTPAQLVGVRALHGLASGVGSASSSLVAAETPRTHVASALGLLSSARSVGQALGPAVGGIAATFLPLRAIFVVAGAVQIGAGLVVAAWVRESTQPAETADGSSVMRWLRTGASNERSAIATLLVAAGLVQFAFASAQQLVALRMIELRPDQAALGIGVAFTGLSVASVGAGVAYSKVGPRVGFRRVATASGLLVAGALGIGAWAPDAPPLVAATVLVGLGYGVVSPALSSMLGLEAPAALVGSLFGLQGSVLAVGMAAGPLVGGVIAATAGTGAALVSAGIVAAFGAVVVAAGAREPPVD